MTNAYIDRLALGLEANRAAQASSFTDHDELQIVGWVNSWRKPIILAAEKIGSIRSLNPSCAVTLFKDAIGFDLNEPGGVDEARNLDEGAGGANTAKDLAMSSGCVAPPRNVRQH